MFCPKCGKEVPEGTAFCPGCGTAISGAPAAVPAQAAVTAVKTMDPKKKKTVIIAVAAVAAVALVLVILFATGVLGKASIVGTWEDVPLDDSTPIWTYTFNADGTGVIVSDTGYKWEFTYILEGNILTIPNTYPDLSKAKVVELTQSSMKLEALDGQISQFRRK